MAELTGQDTVTVNVDENGYLLSVAPRADDSGQQDDSGESQGRIVRLAFTEGADGQQVIQEVPAEQTPDMDDVPQEGNLIQHIQIQPIGEGISQGETITLSLEEAQQLLQQHIVAGEGVEGVQPGIYQILGSGLTHTVDGQMFITPGDGAVSVLQPGTAEALSGFSSQTTGLFFHPSADNLQSQLEQDSNIAKSVNSTMNNNGTANQSIINSSSQQIGTMTFSDTQSTASLERNGNTIINQSAPSSQSERTLHVDFHVHQPGNLIDITNQQGHAAVKTEQSDTTASKDGSLQTGTEPSIASWSMVLPISAQSGLADVSNIQSTVKNESHTGIQLKEATTETDIARTQARPKSKAASTPTPKKPAEIRPDLRNPIEVKEEMQVVVKGKKCMLAVDPETGKLTAYPILPPEGKKRRGRPRKTEQEKAQDAANVADSGPVTDQTSSAAQCLLELSNTGPDGIRRSGRVRKKARTLEDYEILEASSDEEGSSKTEEDEGGLKRQKLEADYLPPISFPVPTPVKRGRGRPRRYPPPGQTTTTQIPAMIIPTSDGSTIMMAPIQGLNNLQAFQEQVKNISLIPKNLTDTIVTSAAVADDTAQLLDTSMTYQTSEPALLDSTLPSSSGVSPQVDPVVTGDESSPAIVIQSKLPPHEIPPAVMANSAISQTDIAEEVSAHDLPETEDSSEDLETKDAIDSLEETNRITVKNGDNQPTIIQIPENLLPLFMQKKEPLKLGLKSSEDELEKMKCIKCNFQAYYEQQYQTHIATHTDCVHKCKACNFVSFEKEELLNHFRENHPKCICNVCDFMAEHGYMIKRHMMRHNTDGSRCDICGKVYKDQYVLKMHIKMVHMPAEVLFECMVCSKKFTRKAHLKRHLRIHDPEKPFKCPHCAYRGCERSDISKHLLIHEEPKHICEVCGKAFRHIKNKELHLKRHNGQRDYKCGVCDFYGYTFTDIRKHIERKHTDAKTIICDKCGSAFKTDWHLKEHQRLGNCEMFMIEQALAIATSDGSTSKATIQIPTSMSLEGVIEGQQMHINGQNIILDGNTGQFNIKVEQMKLPGEAVTLTEEQIQEAVAQGQIIDASSEEMIMAVDEADVHPVKLGPVGDVCLSDNEEDNEDEEEETEEDINELNRNIHSMVSEMSD